MLPIMYVGGYINLETLVETECLILSNQTIIPPPLPRVDLSEWKPLTKLFKRGQEREPVHASRLVYS